MVYNYGKMVHIISDNGKMTQFTDKADWSIQMEIYMMVIGRMIKPMVLVFFIQKQVKFIKESGKTIYKMEKEWKNGQMVHNMKVIIKMV